MDDNFLPSFVKRKGRITKYQINNLKDIEKYRFDINDSSNNNFNKKVLEIGFGDGEHLIKIAEQDSDVLFIGSEVYQSGIGSVIGAIKSKALKNVRIFDQDIRNLLINLTKPYFDDVVIICPDPWQKARHHKRRLINNDFLEVLANTLKTDGELFVSTDWDNYAESIHETLEQNVRFSLNKNSNYNNRFLTKFQKRAIKENRKISNFFFKRTI